MRSFEPGPKMASIASRLSDLAASTSALPASSGEAKVFCTTVVAAGCSCFLLHETREITSAKSAQRIQRCETLRLSCNIPILRPCCLSCFRLKAVEVLRHYRRPPPPWKPPPPPQPPQPRELAERSPQPPPPKSEEPEWLP